MIRAISAALILATSSSLALAQADITADDYTAIVASVLVYGEKCKSITPDVPDQVFKNLAPLQRKYGKTVKNGFPIETSIKMQAAVMMGKLEKEPDEIGSWCQTIYETLIEK